MDPAGKVALVTGATKGIGRAVALALAERGAKLLLVARTETDLADARKACLDAGSPHVATVAADLGDLKGLDAVVLMAVREFDGFDILVNSAGYGMKAPLVAVTDEQFERMINVNLRAPFMLTQSAVKMMRRRGGGQVVQLASGLAYRGLADWSVYAAAKFGLRGFTESVRAEVAGEGIKIGLVAPGYVETDFHKGLPGQAGLGGLAAGDVAHAVMSMILQPAGSDIKEIIVRHKGSPN